MRRATLLLVAAAAAALSASSARAMIVISADRGGLISNYAERFLSARAAGERVVIDGACLSACTLVVGMMPRDRICATPKAVLGFHSAWLPRVDGGKINSLAASTAMMEIYPAELRQVDRPARWPRHEDDVPSGPRARSDRAALRNVRERRRPRHPQSARSQIGYDSHHVRRAANALAVS
jgi:hypothetical protein